MGTRLTTQRIFHVLLQTELAVQLSLSWISLLAPSLFATLCYKAFFTSLTL